MYLGLNVGEVFYGNVGSTERLDFTVVGPAVNEASRIAAMCRSVEQPVLVSVRRTRRRTMRRWAESAGARRWTGCAMSWGAWNPRGVRHGQRKDSRLCGGGCSSPSLARRRSNGGTLRRVPCFLLYVPLSASPARADRVDDYVREQMRLRHVPGLALAVVRDMASMR